MIKVGALAVIAALACSAVARAQSPVATPSSEVVPPSRSPLTPEAAPAEPYAYDPQGRRDPFRGLLAGSAEPRAVLKRGDGPAGYTVTEIAVRGVVQSRGLLVAVVQGPDKRTYIVHSGDKLADGVVKSVTAEGLVILQNINDPLSTQKQREVRKLLRPLDDSKEPR